jgi:hypothetical protein
MNILLGLLGFFTFEWGNFMITKDSFDDAEKEFPYRSYCKKNWENWVFTFLIATIIILVGKMALDISVIPEWGMKWNDLYHLAAGPVSAYAVKRIKQIKQSSKE